VSLVKAVLEALQLGEASDYRGPKAKHQVKYRLGEANLRNLARVQALGGQVQSQR
jgi:hypothetical protein